MRNTLTLTAAVALASAVLVPPTSFAQYPTGPEFGKAKAEADARQEQANRLSDAAWVKAQEVVKAEAAKGKPYIPWASHPFDLRQAQIPAFPGAEGGGMYSFGGRGGKVYVVTSLEDSGPGTFREALEAGGARTVVFNVAGIIKLKNRIRVRAPYVTIAGQTAPGDGVCIAGNTVELETHDIVIRHMRFRRGETNAGERNDSIGGNPIGNVIIDHVSASWGLDENMSMYRHMHPLNDDAEELKDPFVRSKYREMHKPTDPKVELKLPTVNITIQNSIFSEGLNTFHHAFGSTIGGRNSTFHHNLWACNTGRNPSVGMDGDFALVNNVIFNYVHRTVDGGDFLSTYNIVNNYFKPGPATPMNDDIAYRILKPEQRRGKDTPKDYGHAYVYGNVVEGNEKVTKDNWDGGVQIELDEKDTRDPKMLLKGIQVDRPFSIAPITVTNAKEAFDTVLGNAGATMPKRDAVDARVTEMVRTGKASAKAADTIADDLGHAGYSKEAIQKMIDLIPKGIITHPSQVGGYPEYKGTPYKDSDSDGMPDEWESKRGLNPNDASDASKSDRPDAYTNIELFLAEAASGAK